MLAGTTTLPLSAARSRSRRLDWLRLVICALALTLLFAVLVAASPALAAEPEVTITAPNGGEDWAAGSVQTLHWQPERPGQLR